MGHKTDSVLLEILDLCLMMDKKAHIAYTKMADYAKKEELRSFWESMAQDEKEHIGYWSKLISFAETTTLPSIFDDPVEVKKELQYIDERVDELLARITGAPSITNTFHLAYRLEFYMIHPTFKTLFQLLTNYTNEPNPEEAYEMHLDRFVEGIARFGKNSPDLVFMGDAIKKLWDDNKELIVQSNVDLLTGVYNRRGFFTMVKPLAHLAQRNHFEVGMLVIDIDHFKIINDTYGHQTGDEVIKNVVTAIQTRLRMSDIIGRFGGEEFVIYLSSVVPEALPTIAEDLRRRVAEECGKEIPVTISIGASHGCFPRENESEEAIDMLIRQADTCLYQAKEGGRNRVVLSM